jgi:hypothetical protein
MAQFDGYTESKNLYPHANAYVIQNGKLVPLNGRDPVMISDADDNYRLYYKNEATPSPVSTAFTRKQ